jgi:hypothetical protein
METDTTDPPFDNFCREILISFGIIFGQDSRSREAAAKFVREHWPQQIADESVFRSLCGARGWKDHALFEFLNSPPIRSNYSADVDFPFFGRKLARVQEYMDAQSPNDFRALIFDRRDHLRYWTFISVLAFGVLSISIGFIQIFLTMGQIIQASG